MKAGKLFAGALMFFAGVLFFNGAYSQNMYEGRVQWLKMSAEEQKAAYQKATGEDKIKIWNDKFVETENLDWSAAELNHIKEMRKFMFDNMGDLFLDGKNKEKAMASLQDFTTKWMNEGKEKFRWSKELMFHIVADTGVLTNEMLKQLRG